MKVPNPVEGACNPFSEWTPLAVIYVRQRIPNHPAPAAAPSEFLHTLEKLLRLPSQCDGRDDGDGDDRRRSQICSKPTLVLGSMISTHSAAWLILIHLKPALPLPRGGWPLTCFTALPHAARPSGPHASLILTSLRHLGGILKTYIHLANREERQLFERTMGLK